MPNPQLTGAGLGGLGFLETHHFMEFLQPPRGKGSSGCFPVQRHQKVERKKETNHQRSIRDPWEIHQMWSEIHSPNFDWFRLIFILILFALQSSSADLGRLLVSTTSNEIRDWRKVPKPSSHRDTERFKILSFKKMMTNEQNILKFQNICNKKSQNRQHLRILLDWNSKRAKESLQIWQGSYLHLYLYLRAALALVILDWANRLAKSSRWRPGFNYLHRALYIHESHVTHWNIAGAVRPCKTVSQQNDSTAVFSSLFCRLAENERYFTPKQMRNISKVQFKLWTQNLGERLTRCEVSQCIRFVWKCWTF